MGLSPKRTASEQQTLHMQRRSAVMSGMYSGRGGLLPVGLVATTSAAVGLSFVRHDWACLEDARGSGELARHSQEDRDLPRRGTLSKPGEHLVLRAHRVCRHGGGQVHLGCRSVRPQLRTPMRRGVENAIQWESPSLSLLSPRIRDTASLDRCRAQLGFRLDPGQRSRWSSTCVDGRDSGKGGAAR